VTFSVEVHADEVIHELDRLARGPGAGPTTFRLEAIMLGAFTATQERVHVITGVLKGSGHPSSAFDGETWTGEIGYVRHPGIFELARGNRPTVNHPEGEHYFLGPAYDTDEPIRQAILGFLGLGGEEPAGGE
jgi:hypothetical protein